LYPYVSIFERKNTTDVDAKTVWTSGEVLTVDEEYAALSQCNLTMILSTSQLHSWIAGINQAYDTIVCKHVIGTSSTNNIVNQYFGLNYLQFIEVEDMLVQSGIYGHYEENERFLQDLYSMRVMELKMVDDNLPIILTMKDWKILSIFVIWAALLLIAHVVFVVEYVNSRKKKVFAYLEVKLRVVCLRLLKCEQMFKGVL